MLLFLPPGGHELHQEGGKDLGGALCLCECVDGGAGGSGGGDSSGGGKVGG